MEGSSNGRTIHATSHASLPIANGRNMPLTDSMWYQPHTSHMVLDDTVTGQRVQPLAMTVSSSRGGEMDIASNTRQYTDKELTPSRNMHDVGLREDPLRTVRIDEVSNRTAIHDIIKDLRFGIIVDVKVAAFPPDHGANTVFITFLEADAARRCIGHVLEKNDTLHMLQADILALAMHPEPVSSVRMKPHMRSLIQSGTVSRTLRVSGLPEKLGNARIAIMLTVPGSSWHGILAVEDLDPAGFERQGRSVRIHFNSVENAIAAFQRAHRAHLLRFCEFIFDSDPCDPTPAKTWAQRMPLPKWVWGPPAEPFVPRRWGDGGWQSLGHCDGTLATGLAEHANEGGDGSEQSQVLAINAPAPSEALSGSAGAWSWGDAAKIQSARSVITAATMNDGGADDTTNVTGVEDAAREEDLLTMQPIYDYTVDSIDALTGTLERAGTGDEMTEGIEQVHQPDAGRERRDSAVLVEGLDEVMPQHDAIGGADKSLDMPASIVNLMDAE